MAKVIDNKLDSIDTSWEGYAGSRVEEFIKDKFRSLDTSKYGYLSVESGDAGLQIMRFFRDSHSYEQWFSDKITYADNVLSTFEFYSNRPEATFTTKATIVKYLNNNMSKGSSNTFSISYNCYWDTDPTQKDTSNGLIEVTINNVKIAALTRELVPSGIAQGNVYTLELKDYLVNENNKVVIRITNDHGFDKSFTFNIVVYDLKLSFANNYNESIVQFGKWNLRVNCSGASANVYCKVTNGTNTDVYTKEITNSSGEFIIDLTQNYALGIHNITIWAENKELGLKTEELTTTYVKGSTLGNGVPVLTFGKGIVSSAKQFSVINIPYYFYLPNDKTGSDIIVNIEVLYNNDASIKTLSNQVITLDASHMSGLHNIVLNLDDSNYLPEITVRIKIGTTLVATKKIKVESIGVTIKDIDECKIYYNMKGKSNDDSNAKQLVSNYNGEVTSRFVRSRNFNLDENNGFLDGYGITIRPGKELVLKDYLPFSTDCGANGTKTGKTIELEFQSGVCANENDVIISCWSAGTGFKIMANRIVFGCNSDTVTTYFPERSRIKVSFVIDGTTTHTRNDLGGNNIVENDANLAYLYINGTIVRVFNYKTASWQQGDAKNIVIGCPTALVELYSLRIYDKPLTFNQIVSNYAYDTPDVDDVFDSSGNFVRYGKINIAKRNDILNSIGDIHKPQEIISYTKVIKALPTTPIIEWDIDALPFNKNNPDVVINGTIFRNPQWDATVYGDTCSPFSVGTHMFNADGTSSNSYPLPYKNFAENFKTSDGKEIDITLDPEHSSKIVKAYSITKGIIKGETELVHKVNFASSEGIFNIHAMNIFHKILLGCAKTNEELYTKFQRQQRDAAEEITYRKSLSGFPEIGFRRTSTSGNEAPTFLSFYNFINNKYNASIFGFPAKDYKVAQIWEIDENVNFFNRYVTQHSYVNGVLIKSNITGQPIYYARIPKKSSTNKVNKFGAVKSATDNIDAANKEIACISRFHNWVVDCNYHLAERYKKQHGDYRVLDSPVRYNDVTYTKDSVDYRKAKFINEYKPYLVKSDAIFYFIFIEGIIGMDSGDKNMSIAFDDIITLLDGTIQSAPARLFLRDTDSRDLFNNSGVLSFKYWHEWNDSFNSATGKTLQMSGEDYNNDTNTWNPHLEQGFSPVFNGRYSGLMDLIWSCWSDDIKSIYKLMQSNGFNAKDMFAEYLSYWRQLCENIYNADAMGYVNTNNFEKAYGDKLQLSKYFYTKRFRYLDSKYCCGQSIVNNLRLRLYENGKGIAIKHYSPMYASVQWGANNFVTKRSIDGDYALIPFGFSNPQNATFDIDDCDMITDIKTYTRSISGEITYYGFEGFGNFYFDANMGLCTSLTEFIMNYSDIAPNTLEEGTSFDLSKMTLLKKIIVTNVKNLRKIIDINSEICEEIDFTGSGILGVKSLPNQYLKKLSLPESIIELNLTGFTSLQANNLVLTGTDNVNKFVYYDCPNIDFTTMLVKLAANGKLKFIEAKNIDLTITDKSVWDILINSNSKLQGKITLKDFTLSVEDKIEAIRKWGNIDDVNNSLYIKYTIIQSTDIKIIGPYYINDVVPTKFNIEIFPINANDINTVEWSINENKYAIINPNTGILDVSKISEIKDDASAKTLITIQAAKSNNTIITKTFEVCFAKHEAQLGDMVLDDGTVTDRITDSTKSIIGYIGYIYETKNKAIVVQKTYENEYWMFAEPTKQVIERYNLQTILTTNPIEYDENNLTKVLKTSYQGYVAGSILPRGLVNTIELMIIRDKILSYLQKDIKTSNTGSADKTLYKYFNNLIVENRMKREDVVFLYMATVSAVWEYSTLNNIVSDSLGTHRWYIPSTAELKVLLKNKDIITSKGSKLFNFTSLSSDSIPENNKVRVMWLDADYQIREVPSINWGYVCMVFPITTINI